MDPIPWRNKGPQRGVTEITPDSPLEYFKRELARLFDRFLRQPWRAGEFPLGLLAGWSPAVDILESDDEVTLRAEIPGVEPGDLDITVSGSTLTLAGEKVEPGRQKGRDFYHSERRFGSFRRSIHLPASVDADQVSAEYVGGVLTVRMQKRPGAARKRVPVTVKE